MDNIFARQMVAFCNLCVARRAAVKRSALRKELGSCRAMNAAVHAASAEKRIVRSVHDGVNLQLCYVVSDYLKWHINTSLSLGWNKFNHRICNV